MPWASTIWRCKPSHEAGSVWCQPVVSRLRSSLWFHRRLRAERYARLFPLRARMRAAVLLLALIGLGGCGIKGPLYIPTPQQQREMAEREKRLQERTQREKEQEQAQQQAQQRPQSAPQPAPTEAQPKQ